MLQFFRPSRETSIVSLLAAAVFACSAPSRSTGTSSGGTTGGGNTTGGGSGGNGVITGTGNTNGSGTGGGGVIAGGSGGTTGGPASGSGGNGDVVLGSGGATGQGGPDAGVAGGSSGNSGTPGTGGATKTACAAVTTDPFPYTAGYTPDPATHSAAVALAGALSNTEQQQQMTGLPQTSTSPSYNVFRQEDNTTHTPNIKGFRFRDGPRGVNLSANGDNKGDYSTAFPVAIARGAAFDETLEYHVGQAVGDELLASGNTMLLAPTTNILRHPAWGRAQETYGEDSFLLGRLGSAFVTGVQEYAAACAKHYAANNIENGRETANAIIDEQTLREVYARHFEMMIQEGGVSSIMASYNSVNGVHSTQSSHLLTDLLRTDFGFKGFVLSDWWAMPNGSSANLYNQPTTLQPVAVQALQAGLDMELPWRFNYSTLTALQAAGMIQASQLATSTARILEQKMRFKVDSTTGSIGLRTPFTTYNSNSSIDKNDQVDPIIKMSHIDLAQQAAEESMVLLKNDKSTLPISRTTYKNIAVIGANVSYQVQSTVCPDACSSGGNGTLSCTLDFTTNVRTGDCGSSRVFADPAKSTGPLAGIKAAAGAGITVTSGNNASAAANADFVVVIVGLTPQDEGEEYTGAGDRTTGSTTSSSHTVNLGLDAKGNTNVQNGLVTAVAALGKPMVVVLEGGGVIDLPWISSVPAVVMAWYPGMAGGKALGRLLFGDANFSGKLPVTWSSNVSDWPTFASGNGTTTMDYYLGYRYFDNKGTKPQFSFGYGMSYTTFNYANLNVPCSTVDKNGVVNVTVDVSNNSPVAGDETVFLFVSYPGSAVPTRAGNYKELKGFHRVSLAAKGTTGDMVRITIPLRVKDLKYWDGGATGSWKVESGMVKVMVAPSAAAATTVCAGGTGSGCALSDTFAVN
jgi:beta-glucosidase